MTQTNIFVTGDTHGDLSRLSLVNLPCENWLYKDILIVLGDFGFVFHDDLRDRERLDRLERLPFQLCFVDGNHENFHALEQFPVELWNGGKVRRIRSNIRHLMRGQVFTIDGTKLFTMGGAHSIDKAYRREGFSWWPEEMPSEAEYAEALENLEANGMQVDYILTHTAPWETVALLREMRRISDSINMEEAPLNQFLETVREKVSYTHWFFGHFHLDLPLWRDQTAVFCDVRTLPGGEQLKGCT